MFFSGSSLPIDKILNVLGIVSIGWKRSVSTQLLITISLLPYLYSAKSCLANSVG